MNRAIGRSYSLAFLLVAALSTGLVGCKESLSDDAFGSIDLAPFYADGAMPGNIAAGVPKNIAPIVWNYEGRVGSEYYDFGYANASVGAPDPTTRAVYQLSASDKAPQFAPTAAMYFFFDRNGNPMTSRPVREARTWNYYMRGGKGVLNPNPTAKADKALAYPVRARALWTDPKRNVADYQRPLIDKLPSDSDYSGLFEIVAVKAKGDYDPDSIKSVSTLLDAVRAGDFEPLKPTGYVINCPLVDDRTYVVPGVQGHNIPRPRIEYWYRRKLGSCFLADGWEALGRIDDKGNDEVNDDEFPLFGWNEDDQRLNVMDVVTNKLGVGNAAVSKIVSPVSRLFVPRLNLENAGSVSASSLLSYKNAVAEGSPPRRIASDPPGYRPIRWVWSILIPQRDPPYSPGRDLFPKAASALDATQVDRSQNPFIVRNFPYMGSPVLCTDPVTTKPLPQDPCPKLGLECPAITGNDNRGECVAKVAHLNEYCSPGVAQCAVKARDNVESKLFATTIKQAGTEGAKGYTCHGGAISGTGHCYLQCDGGQPNELLGERGENTGLKRFNPTTGKSEDYYLPLDSRCGGTVMPGFQCLPITDVTKQGGGRMCLRLCDVRDPIDFNNKLCTYKGADFTPVPVTQDLNVDPTANTKCLTASSVTACIKDYAFEPAQ